MKTKTYFALVAVLGLSLLASCTINPHPMDMTQSVQSAKTRSDHERLAKHYEDAAKEMQAKAAEHNKMRVQYEANNRLYGEWAGFEKQSSSLIRHCQALVRIYEQAAFENVSMAESHRQMAAEAK